MRVSLARLACLSLLAVVSLPGRALAQEETTTPDNTAESKPKPPPVDDEDPNFDPNNRDWGTYYDPQNIFCGSFDCYKILGFDYESFGKNHPDTRKITKRFRKLSRAWHPDKSSHRDAKERFVKISRAYEVLTKDETRKEYDFLRYNQEAYFQKYGTSVLFSYAPKSDVTFVLILILIIAIIVTVGAALREQEQKNGLPGSQAPPPPDIAVPTMPHILNPLALSSLRCFFAYLYQHQETLRVHPM